MIPITSHPRSPEPKDGYVTLFDFSFQRQGQILDTLKTLTDFTNKYVHKLEYGWWYRLL